MRQLPVASLIAVALLATACGGSTATPTAAQPTRPAATAPSTPAATTAAPAATVAVPAPTRPAATAAATAAATPAAGAPTAAAAAAAKPAAARAWKVAPEQSQVTLKVNERLADRPTNNDAVLSTRAISGQVVVGPDGRILEGSKLTVDLNTLQSDSGMRDRFIKGNTLDVRRYPNAEFTPTELRGLPNPLPTSGDVKGQLVGTMTIRETSRPVTFDLAGRIEGSSVTGTATGQLKLTDYMQLPRVPSVLSIEDLARLEITFTATT